MSGQRKAVVMWLTITQTVAWFDARGINLERSKIRRMLVAQTLRGELIGREWYVEPTQLEKKFSRLTAAS